MFKYFRVKYNNEVYFMKYENGQTYSYKEDDIPEQMKVLLFPKEVISWEDYIETINKLKSKEKSSVEDTANKRKVTYTYKKSCDRLIDEVIYPACKIYMEKHPVKTFLRWGFDIPIKIKLDEDLGFIIKAPVDNDDYELKYCNIWLTFKGVEMWNGYDLIIDGLNPYKEPPVVPMGVLETIFNWAAGYLAAGPDSPIGDTASRKAQLMAEMLEIYS